MELTIEKSTQLAQAINSIKVQLLLGEFDIDYAKSAAEGMREQAFFQDSAAVLNPKYDPLKQQIIRKQASALESLITFVETLKEVDEMKKELSKSNQIRSDIEKIFI